jgi:hypothetical protein
MFAALNLRLSRRLSENAHSFENNLSGGRFHSAVAADSLCSRVITPVAAAVTMLASLCLRLPRPGGATLS